MEKKLEKLIHETLLRLCEGRGKQEEVASKFGISRPYLNRLLRGECPISGLTVGTLEKMFPNMAVNLNGDGVNAVNIGTVNGGVGMNSGTVNASESSLRLRIMEALVGLEIPADALQIVLKTIKEVK